METQPIEFFDTRPWNEGDYCRTVSWTEKGLRIVRLRLISDPGFPRWDVSYCLGWVGDEPVYVALPFDQVPKGTVKSFIVSAGRADGVYVKGLGVFGALSFFQ